MDNISEKSKILAVYLILILIICAVFGQVHSFEFINYDDPSYVNENVHIVTGLKWHNIVWVFTNGHGGNFHPLTGLSYMLDCQLFGLKPGLHHLVNLLFHIANTALLFIVLRQMTTAIWQSAFVAALFALHPLHIEPVAWISSRKDVLSTLFFLLTIGAYSRYVKSPTAGSYILTLVFFALGLMAKPMLVTLPFVLLLLDYWPLKRLEYRRIGNRGREKKVLFCFYFQIGTWRNLIWEKFPFFVVTGVSSVITYLVFKSIGIVQNTQTFPLSVRIANAVMSYIRYIWKMLWPARLAVFYPHPLNTLPLWQVLAAATLLLFITIFVVRFAKKHKYLFVGWFWYVGTLVPVIGLVTVGIQAMADRYSYIPLIGLFIIVAWGANDLLTGWKYRKVALGVLSITVVLILSIGTYLQTSHWRNSQMLFEHAVEVTHENYVAYNYLGLVLIEQNNFNESLNLFHRAIQANPCYALARSNLGFAYSSLGRYEEAVEAYKDAIRINPNYATARYNLGVIYDKVGCYQEAVDSYRQTTRIKPAYADAYYNLGVIYGKLGHYQEAIEAYRQAVKIKPDDASAYNNLGDVCSKLDRYEDAIGAFKYAIKIKPDLAEAYCNLGFTYGKLGRHKEAIDAFKQAIKLNPDYADAYYNMGVMYWQQGQFNEVVESCGNAIKIKPDYVEACYVLGLCYVVLGEKDLAVEEYKILKTLDEPLADELFEQIPPRKHLLSLCK